MESPLFKKDLLEYEVMTPAGHYIAILFQPYFQRAQGRIPQQTIVYAKHRLRKSQSL